MTSREKVLKVYPDALCVKYNEAAMGELYQVFNAAGEPLSDLMFQNADCAWEDAASKLPPGSPAGETASKPDDCEVCRGAKGGVKGNENVVDGKKVCDYCHAAAVPELVPAEGAAELRKRAADFIDGLARYPYTARLENPYREIAIAMKFQEMSAAPIAPAAEELIQELVDALWEAAQSLRTIADGAGRREFMEHMDQVRGYANSRANVAHELAEEYRKGAKNA